MHLKLSRRITLLHGDEDGDALSSTLMLPLYLLESTFLDTQTALKPSLTRYIFFSDQIVSLDDDLENASSLASRLKEMTLLTSVFKEYRVKLDKLRTAVKRNIVMMAANSKTTWEQTMSKSEKECRIRLFCLKKTANGLKNLEDTVESALQDCAGILQILNRICNNSDRCKIGNDIIAK